MAVLFYRAIQNLYAGAIHRQATSSSISEVGSGSTTSTWAVTIFPGVQPSAATITSNWTNYNTIFLAHWSSVSLRTNNTKIISTQIIALNVATSSVTSANSGDAGWALLWPTNPNQATISGATLPSTEFIVVPVTLIASNGAVRFNSLTFTSGSSYTITELSFVAGGGIS